MCLILRLSSVIGTVRRLQWEESLQVGKSDGCITVFSVLHADKASLYSSSIFI